MTTSTPALAPVAAARDLVRLNLAYTRARVLHSAVEVGLFDLLAGGAHTVEEICERLALHPRLAGDWLAALARLGLLTEDAGRYANGPAAEHFLVPGGPYDLAGSVGQHGRVHFPLWGLLTEALRDGAAKSDARTGAGAAQDGRPDPERTRRFLAHMDAFNGFVAEELCRVLDWGRFTSVLDVGGARGNVAARLVLAHPHLRAVVFDVPGVEPFFDEHMAALGTTGRVRFAGGDFFTDPLPAADVAILGHVLHDWPEAARRALVAAAFHALRPGGTLLVYDAMLDDDAGAEAFLQSLVCRLIRDGGGEYTVDAARAWVRAAGFRFVDAVALDTVTGDKLLVAEKPGGSAVAEPVREDRGDR